MNKLTNMLAIVTVLALSGCVSHPQTAQEFREAVPGAFTAEIETFEVDRPLQKSPSHFRAERRAV